MAPSTTVAVTGSTGFVGRHLVRELLRRGFRVRALVRDPAKAADVLPGPRQATDHGGSLDLVQGTVLNTASLAELARSSDALVHLVGIIRERARGQTFQNMHVQATANALAAATDARVPRYLHMSALGTRPDHPTAYGRTKAAAERLVHQADLRWTIFRPGLILGDGGEFTQMLIRWAQGRSAPYLFMPYFSRIEVDLSSQTPRFALKVPTVQPVAVEDVVNAFADAIDADEAVGETYNLVGPERIRFDDLLRRVHAATRQAKPDLKPIGLPGQLAAAKAWAMGWLGLRDLLPFDAGMALMGMADAVAADRKAELHLGFRPRPAL